MSDVKPKPQIQTQRVFILAPKGFKSVTLSDDVYDFFYEKYKKKRIMLRRQGIRSFSAYLSYELYLADGIERQKRPYEKARHSVQRSVSSSRKRILQQ